MGRRRRCRHLAEARQASRTGLSAVRISAPVTHHDLDGCITSLIADDRKRPLFASGCRLACRRRGGGVVGRDPSRHQGSREPRGSTLSRCRDVGRRHGEGGGGPRSAQNPHTCWALTVQSTQQPIWQLQPCGASPLSSRRGGARPRLAPRATGKDPPGGGGGRRGAGRGPRRGGGGAPYGAGRRRRGSRRGCPAPGGGGAGARSSGGGGGGRGERGSNAGPPRGNNLAGGGGRSEREPPRWGLRRASA